MLPETFIEILKIGLASADRVNRLSAEAPG